MANKSNKTTKRKATRRLTDIDFSSEGSHMALCHKDNGPANGHDYALVIKSTKFSEETIKKMQQIRVTMELPEFLTTFFDLYWDEAHVLAALMGYERPESEYELQSHEDYIESQLEAFEIMKSVYEADDITKGLADLSEDDYLALLTDQETVEKALKKQEKELAEKNTSSKQKSSTEVKSEVGANTEADAEEPAVTVVKYNKNSSRGWEPTNTNLVKEENMTKKAEVEVVEKSVVEQMQSDFDAAKEELNKAVEAQKEELKKAQEMIEKFQAEKKEAIKKARFAQVKDAVKVEDKAEVLFKALSLVESQEDFDAVVECLKEMTEIVEKSELFVEKGVEGESEVIKEDALKAKLKEKYKK